MNERSQTMARPAGITVLLLALLGAAGHVLATNRDANRNDCSSGASTGRSHVDIVALTRDGRLLCLDERKPSKAREIGHVSGFLGNDTSLIGIDFRVQDGKLYGVGNAGGVYTIDTNTATALPVNVLSVALDGTSFGVDFNPAADRLRIISDRGQNLRHNVGMGGTTLADGALNYTAGTPATSVTGAAYTNNDLDANTATSLFDLDTSLDQIAIQSPPNNGSLVATGKLTIDAGLNAGIDIYTHLHRNVALGNRAFAALTVGGTSCLYRVNLLTGRADRAGCIRDDVVDLAVPVDQ